MSPLRNARVIPGAWSAHHAAAAAGGMNGRCRIYDPATATTGWDAATESATSDGGAPVYDGPCRIEPALSAREVLQADEQETTRTYLVQILFDAAHVEKDWRLVPYEVTNDPELNDVGMTIDDVELGTERFTRDLIVSHTQS